MHDNLRINPDQLGLSAELIEDKNHAGDYRVEAIHPDGSCEVSIFSGPNALERAAVFAGSYYSKWNDHGLAGY